MSRMLTCRELIEFLLDYLEDGLAPAERESFDAHLAICPDCVRYVDSYRTAMHAGRSAFTDPEAELPDEVPEALITAVLAARREG